MTTAGDAGVACPATRPSTPDPTGLTAIPTPTPLANGPTLAPASDRDDERRLIERVVAGDRVAARRLYEAHVGRVHRAAYRIVGDEVLAQECTQEAFVRAFARLDRFRGDATLATWLTRIALTVSLNAVRRRRRRDDRELALDAAAGHAVAPTAGDAELRERLAAAIDALPEIYRVTVVLHDVEGYTHAEIGELLGVPEGTCKTRLFVARRRLREMLADYVER